MSVLQLGAQCGGLNWMNYGACVTGTVCNIVNINYAECTWAVKIKKRHACSKNKSTTSVAAPKLSSSRSSSSTSSSTIKPSNSSKPAVPATVQGQTKLAGINIAGFDFGCDTDGTCVLAKAVGPILTGNSNGTAQMAHFTKSNLNTFRLPVSWQWLVKDKIGGQLEADNFAAYDQLMQSCLAISGATCIIDIHNYARVSGKIIGQGGPTDEQFADFWSQLAKNYATFSNVIFGIMNEPHEVDVPKWAASVQAAVTAIRQAGATKQMISLPGTNYAAASKLISSGSFEALSKVTNPDGTIDNLIFDIHAYLDADNSGTHPDCTTNNIDSALSPLADLLRKNNRMAILSETGGGNTDSCLKLVCEQRDFMDKNSDVFLGFVGWSAGSFDSSYVLSMTPDQDTDKPLVQKCFSRTVAAPV